MPDLFSAPSPTVTSTPLVASSPLDISPRLQAFLATRHSRHHPFSSFMVMPTNVRFETQRDEESILLFMRRHPVTNVPWILLSLVMFILPIIAVPFLQSTELVQQLAALSPGFATVIIGLWYLMVLGYALSNFLVWYFTVNIVTSERVVDIDFFFLLYKEFSEALLDKIEDVTFIMGGFVRAMFDYGDVLIETAAATERIDFDAVPRPRDVVQVISELLRGIR